MPERAQKASQMLRELDSLLRQLRGFCERRNVDRGGHPLIHRLLQLIDLRVEFSELFRSVLGRAQLVGGLSPPVPGGPILTALTGARA